MHRPPLSKEELLSQYDILRTGYIKLLNDKDMLQNWSKSHLIALYNTRIGVHQILLLQIQLSVLSLKRKLEMVRAAIAQQMPVDIAQIESLVAHELHKAAGEIMAQTISIENSQVMLARLDSPTRSAELRSLFKQLAKQLHPDILVHPTPEQAQLWHLVFDAYERKDVDRLRAIKVAYSKELNSMEDITAELTEEQIELQNEVLKQGIKQLEGDIALIRKEFPFTIEHQIKDEDWVKETVGKIGAQVKELRGYEGELILEYQNMKQKYGGTTATAPDPGLN